MNQETIKKLQRKILDYLQKNPKHGLFIFDNPKDKDLYLQILSDTEENAIKEFVEYSTFSSWEKAVEFGCEVKSLYITETGMKL